MTGCNRVRGAGDALFNVCFDVRKTNTVAITIPIYMVFSLCFGKDY